jgi:hypothetical protein
MLQLFMGGITTKATQIHLRVDIMTLGRGKERADRWPLHQ